MLADLDGDGVCEGEVDSAGLGVGVADSVGLGVGVGVGTVLEVCTEGLGSAEGDCLGAKNELTPKTTPTAIKTSASAKTMCCFFTVFPPSRSRSSPRIRERDSDQRRRRRNTD